MPTDFDLQIYDADQIRIAFATVSISKGPGLSGYADGPFCEIDPNGPSFTTKEGTDGTVVRSKTNSRLVKVTITLLQTSSSNGILSTMLDLDEAQPNGAGVGSLVVEDLQGTSKFKALKAWVSGKPKVVWDRGAEARAWELHALRQLHIIGGN